MTDGTILMEPGFWVLMSFVAFALVNVIAAVLLRPKRQKFRDLIAQLAHDTRVTPADKAWLRQEVETSKALHMLIASPFAPGAILGAVAIGLVEGWRAWGDDGKVISYEAQISRIDRETERLHVEGVKLAEGIDPRSGAFWSDPRRKEIQDLSHTIETWSHPLAMLWVLFWLIVSAPLLLASYLVSGSIQPFVKNLWEPMRDPVVAALRLSVR